MMLNVNLLPLSVSEFLNCWIHDNGYFSLLLNMLMKCLGCLKIWTLLLYDMQSIILLFCWYYFCTDWFYIWIMNGQVYSHWNYFWKCHVLTEFELSWICQTFVLYVTFSLLFVARYKCRGWTVLFCVQTHFDLNWFKLCFSLWQW